MSSSRTLSWLCGNNYHGQKPVGPGIRLFILSVGAGTLLALCELVTRVSEILGLGTPLAGTQLFPVVAASMFWFGFREICNRNPEGWTSVCLGTILTSVFFVLLLHGK